MQAAAFQMMIRSITAMIAEKTLGIELTEEMVQQQRINNLEPFYVNLPESGRKYE